MQDAINITAYTNDSKEIDAIKAFLKAFKIKFKINTEKELLIKEIKEAVEELKLVRQGKLKGISAKQLLDEL